MTMCPARALAQFKGTWSGELKGVRAAALDTHSIRVSFAGDAGLRVMDRAICLVSQGYDRR